MAANESDSEHSQDFSGLFVVKGSVGLELISYIGIRTRMRIKNIRNFTFGAHG